MSCADRARRTMLKAAVANLGVAISRGECTPQLVELEALALICDDHQLPAEATRVRRWIAGGSDRGVRVTDVVRVIPG